MINFDNMSPIKPIKMDIYPEYEKPEKKEKPENFENFLKKAIYNVSDAKQYAEKLNRDFMAGNLENLHDLTIAQVEANFKFQTLVEVNNKLIDAYKEISRIQV